MAEENYTPSPAPTPLLAPGPLQIFGLPPVGAAGEVLTVQGDGSVAWDPAAGGGGGGESGVGSPEGVVTAEPGTTYLDTSTGAFWAKQSGSGNTGWLQLIAA